MLIELEIKNWRSFKDPVQFSLVASRQKTHKDRIANINKFNLRLLPITAIFGANASGKSNLIKALSFIRNITFNPPKPNEPLEVEPFILTNNPEAAVEFKLCLLIDELIYSYSLKLNEKEVISEKLSYENSSKEYLVYQRDLNGFKFNEDKKVKDERIKFIAEDERIKFIAESTRPNTLFINSCLEHNHSLTAPLTDWLDKLIIIHPDMHCDNLLEFIEDKNKSSYMSKMLTQLDTGITDLQTVKVDGVPDQLLKHMQAQKANRIKINPIGKDFLLSTDGSSLKRVECLHGQYKIQFNDESDGTIELINKLLPSMYRLIEEEKSEHVILIDEIDRSIHTLAIRQLLTDYLSKCNAATRTQLIFTTHNTELLDQDLLRRDELWAVDKDYLGVSSLTSWCEYSDIRQDRNIRKSYLDGRLGGIPKL